MIDLSMFPGATWDDNTLHAPTHPGFAVFAGAFGGWTVAHAMAAARRLAPPEQTPISCTTEFFKGIVPGDVKSAPQVVSNTKSTTFIAVDTFSAQTLAARTSVVFNRRRETDEIHCATMPDAPPPQKIAISEFRHPVATWVDQYEMRVVSGRVLERNDQLRSLIWSRPRAMASGWSWEALAGFADANLPRIFYHYPELSPIATVSMSTYFLFTETERQALGDAHLLVDAQCTAGRGGVFDQTVNVWSANGALVMRSHQIAVYSVPRRGAS